MQLSRFQLVQVKLFDELLLVSLGLVFFDLKHHLGCVFEVRETFVVLDEVRDLPSV